MPIDIQNEKLLSLAEAARSLPRPVHVSCLHRWRLTGIRGVKLESCLLGGRRFTSIEAIERFVAATTAAANGEPPPSRTPARREADIARAEEEINKKRIPRTRKDIGGT